MIVPISGPPIIGQQPVHLENVDKSVQGLYNSVPEDRRGNGHGHCAEICTLDGKDTDNLKGAVSVAMQIRNGKVIPVCKSCEHVLNKLGIIDGVAAPGLLKAF